MKVCIKCKIEKEINHFRIKKNPDKVKIHKQNHYIKNKAYIDIRNKEWAKNNPDKIKAGHDRYLSKNPQKRKQTVAEWKNSNKNLINANTAYRRSKKIKATIGDFVKEIKYIYVKCPEGYHVDHIVPLINELVCGLHVPWNLQILSSFDNIKKSNKFDGTSENKSWSIGD
jgi:hypothetical protein